MAKPQSAIAKTESSAAPIAIVDELNGIMGVDGFDDGLGEIEASDVKLAALVFNMKGVDRSGDPIAPNVFFNTLEETTTKKVSLVLLQLHKSHHYSEFDNAKNETVTHCRSFDRVTGTMADGGTRACNGCPHQEWRSVEGKRKRDCAEVWNMFGVDRNTQTPVVIRFKKTSQPAIKDYLNKFHIGKRIAVVGGKQKRVNMPLFAFTCEASLKMDDTGKYAVPVLERGEVLPKEEIQAYAVESENVRAYMEKALGQVEAKVTAAEGGSGEGDASFDTDAFKGNGTNDFVETTGSAA